MACLVKLQISSEMSRGILGMFAIVGRLIDERCAVFLVLHTLVVSHGSEAHMQSCAVFALGPRRQ